MSSFGDWSDEGSLTPQLNELGQQWDDVDFDENILSIQKDTNEHASKRRKSEKTDDFDELQFTLLFNDCSNLAARTNKQLLSAGYIKQGFLTRLLNNEEPGNGLFMKPIFTLFDCKFITETALVLQRQKLKYMLRQKYAEFECKQTDRGLSNYIPHVGESCWFYIHIRKQCSCFLMYVNMFIFRNLKSLQAFPDSNDPYVQLWRAFPSNLKEDMDNLWLFLGPVNSLPNSSFLHLEETNASTSQLSPAAHWLHLHLELKWGVLEVLSRLYNFRAMMCMDQLTEIEEKSLAFLMDLVHISTHINICSKGTMPNAMMNTSPFLCACVKELWIIMIHLLDSFSANHGSKSFWSNFTIIVTNFLQTDKDQAVEFPFEVTNITCKNPVQFSWWLLAHVAQLYWYNDKGEYLVKDNASVPGNWLLIQDLLKMSFLSKEVKIQEDMSRCYLTCCLQMTQHWHPNNDIVLLLWDYFHKKMNDRFYLTGQRLQGMACQRDMPYQWFEQVLTRCKDPFHSNDDETSYHLFLRIVALHFQKLKITKPSQGWKQMKGRFYSKFHKKRMEELAEQGLLSFFNLFFTLAYVGELEDVSNKMMSFLDLVDFTSLDYGRKLCVWRGYFVLLFLYKCRKASMEFIVRRVSGMFAEICRDYKEFYNDRSQRHNLWSFISVYLESTQEIFEYESREQTSDHLLIDEGFKALFPVCGEKELHSLANFTQSLLLIVSNEQQGQRRALAQALWQHIFPHIRQHVCHPSASHICTEQMTNLAASFTLLSIEIPPTMSYCKTLDAFHNLVQQFGTKDSVAASVSCQFLGSVLASSQALELIQSSCYQSNIVHTWFRCCLQVSSQDQHLRELTRIVFLKLPEIGGLVKAQKSIAAGNVESALTIFIRNLGDRFSSLSLLAETVAFREKALVYIGDVLKYMEAVLKQAGPLDQLRLSYKVAASLVKDCPRIIYRKTQHDCLLPQIIDQLILPLNTKKQLPPSIAQCIKLKLTEFLEGLASLDFKKDEFIKRKIKQIFATYFHLFNQKYCSSSSNSGTMKNPFLDVLKRTFVTTPSQDASDFRQYVMTIIKENYLVIPGLTPQELTPTLFFLVDVFKRTVSADETARNTPPIIKNILGCLLACETSHPGTEPPHIRKEAATILRLMLESCKKSPDVTPRDVLLSLLKEFISSNINQVQGKIFKVFTTVAQVDRELVLALVPCSREAILATERKRGVGNDTRLRASFTSLLASLGEAGRSHITDEF